MVRIPPKPPNEQQRLATLRGYEILEHQSKAAFNNLTLIVLVLHAPNVGLDKRNGLINIRLFRLRRVPHTKHLQPGIVFIIPRIRSERSWSCSKPKIRFYAGPAMDTHCDTCV